ncbi:MAG: hypothetical protein FWD61_09355 [Phycisphaerales bacterium]|nr:hypothetical protein [Phycisphaerales bacterium]
MYYVKTFLFLVLCFLLGVGLMHGIRHFRGRNADVFATPRIGIGNAPPLRGFALSLDESTPVAIANLPVTQLRATAISLSYPTTGGGGAADKTLAKSVAAAHKKGIQVILLPSCVFAGGNPYPQPLEKIAQEAQTAHVDALCLTWLNSEPDLRDLSREAVAVRKIFSGKLIVAATPDILIAMESFGDVDYIAAIGPVTLPQRLPHASEDVDLHAMRVFWECVLGSLESHAIKVSHGLLLLNMAVPVTIQARLSLPASAPGFAEGLHTNDAHSAKTASVHEPPTDGGRPRIDDPNLDLQQITYEALLMQTKGRTNVEGLFLPWSPQESTTDSTAVNRFPDLVKKIAELWSSAAKVAPVTSEPAPEKETE